MAEPTCFHCGEPVPEGCQWQAPYRDETVHFCCPACLAVFKLIQGSGLDNYYCSREGVAERPSTSTADYSAFDLAEVQADFVSCDEQSCQARLFIEGIHCTACTWLLEHHLSRLPGVVSVQVQLHKQVALVTWQPDALKLSRIFSTIAELGYRPLPYRASARDELIKRTRRSYLGRIGVAGIAAMQVGMFAVALYAGEFQDMQTHWRDLLRYFSLLLATAVVFYSARPFFEGAWRSVRQGVAGMDVPVALAIALAYVASLWATFTGSGQVYFDSVCMFTLFLLTSRYLEFQARSAQWFFPRDLLPETALRCVDNQVERVALRQLQTGDVIQVAAGETVPVDGRVSRGQSALNEAAFTGEFMPVEKAPGDRVLAGSVNVHAPIDIEVTALSENAVLQGIERLADRALAHKPEMTQLADRLSHYFVTAVLLICVGTAWYWFQVDSARALWVSLAVLVVSCPCALSLATPTAVATALRQLQRQGVLVTRGTVLETLPTVQQVVFDKTGTLTLGQATLADVYTTGHCTEERCLAIAGALEARSTHPLARAFQQGPGKNLPAQQADHVRHVAGCGVEGSVDSRDYRLGSATFCGDWLGAVPALPDEEGHWLALCDRQSLLAWFVIADPLRSDARETVADLLARGMEVHLLSGDSSGAVSRIARQLGLAQWRAGASAADKLDYVRQLQQSGPVLVVGDGINDLPVMAAADVSVAMTEASDLSKTQADCVLLTTQLQALSRLIDVSGRSCQIIRQNLLWALMYNALAIPLAAMGWIPPYAAALGMSLSSLLVVANSRRLARFRPAPIPLLRQSWLWRTS